MNGSNGNGNGNQLGGFLSLPQTNGNGASSGSDQFDVPGVGNIKKGQSVYHTEFDHDRMIYGKLVSAANTLDHLRGEMDKLALMGDTVSPEDVIAAAGRVVGHGVPARELAGILADMPSQAGQGLAAWVGQRDQALTQQEQHVMQMREIAQHRMGASAVRVLAVNHLIERRRQQAAAVGAQAATAGALGPRPRGAAAAPSPAGALAPSGGMPQPQVVQMMQTPESGSAGGEG